MLNLCIGCYKKTKVQYNLCEYCLLDLEPIIHENPKIVSLYSYKGVMRDLLLRAKIDGDFRALHGILNMMKHSKRINQMVQDADYLVSVPANAVSRWKGRVDVAWHLTNQFRQMYGTKRLSTPLKLRWRFHKRSQILNRELKPEYLDLKTLNKPKLLIIDDVLTTGHSLYNVGLSFKGYNLYYLTLASALSEEF